jgi:arabinan endo-1,5-alpha-L-arabinosidase
VRRVVAIVIALGLSFASQTAAARAFPSPEECAAGNANGVYDEGAPHGAVCVGAAGHNVAYVGGDPANLCGTVIVADINVIDGPTPDRGSDPNHCPYAGWPTVVHDPAVALDRGTYYLFGTGPGIPMWTSTDRTTWRSAGTVFDGALPDWATAAIPGTQFPWAPDVSFFAGEWHLYYAISTFGSKTSAIGFATNPTLDRDDPRYRWTDRGEVIRSGDTTEYNAIDPNVFVDKGRVRLTFGSAFGGLRAADLDDTGHITSQLTPLATRIVPTWVIEAAFVVRRGGYYYLFASFDSCCRGADSTYNVRVGRSRHFAGPYVDDHHIPMLVGGGRLVLKSQGTRRGPGHEAVLRDGNQWRLFFHYYDATTGGTARLGILPIRWTGGGWPVVTWSAFQPTHFDPP